jgi:hypothetical protein
MDIDPKYLTDVAPDIALLVCLVLPMLHAAGKVGCMWAAWALLSELTRYIKHLRTNH